MHSHILIEFELNKQVWIEVHSSTSKTQNKLSRWLMSNVHTPAIIRHIWDRVNNFCIPSTQLSQKFLIVDFVLVAFSGYAKLLQSAAAAVVLLLTVVCNN